MLDMYNNYQKYIKLAPEARIWAKQYSYHNIKPLFINLVKPSKIILGRENKVTKDYIETTSENIYQKYQNIIR